LVPFQSEFQNMAMMKNLLLVIFLVVSMQCLGINVEVQGHRGTRGLRPENTLPSFMAAIEAGVDALELDLLVTQEGELVIHHDYYINDKLCTHLDGSAIQSPAPLIHSLSLSQIKQFDCGRKINPRFPKQQSIPGTQIPTLKELFAALLASSHPNAKKVRLNLEMKRDPLRPELTAEPAFFAKELLKLVSDCGFKNRVYYSSFDPRMLAEVKKLDPKATIAFLKEDDLEGFVETAKKLKADIVSPDHELLKNSEEIKALKELGFRVVVWTVNDVDRCNELIQMGVDGIITDYPQDIIAKLK
jgi:glycerophosphoryl diester phosphodiesterase